MITYLKDSLECSFIAYNKSNLSSVEVFRSESCNISKYDSFEELRDSLNYSIEKNDFELSNREEFNNAVKAYSENYNNLIKKL